MRVVLDTNALLDLLHFDDPRCARLREALRAREAIAVATPASRAEFFRVLRYLALRLDDARIAMLEAAHDALVEPIDASPRDIALPRCRDRDDQGFLELARDAQASLLVTRDRELLRLARRTRREAGFDVIVPEDFAPD